MKAIIYCRKSTDRGDRQQLSIEAQEQEALKIAKREGLEVIKIFKETMSAKEPGRPCFNEMMKLFNNHKADCIVTWKLNRLARNPVDEGTIKWSIQSGVIKAIFTEGETFKSGDNVLIMGMHFGMSTQYILDLQKDIKRGINSKISNGGVCQKAPLGYVNIIATKSIAIDKTKSEWVKEMFTLRSQNMAYKTISEILFKKGIKRDNGDPFSPSTIETLLKNKFYIGLVKHNGEYYKGSYETFISKKLFESAQNIGQGIHYRENTPRLYHLKGFIKDDKGFLLSGYSKKGNIYYKNSGRGENININQDKIFKYFLETISNLELDEDFKILNKEIILEILEKQKPKDDETIKEIEFKIKKLNDQKDKLLDLRIEGEIEKDIFNLKNNDIVLKIEDLEIQKNELKDNKLQEKVSVVFELIENLSTSYKRVDSEGKTVILKNLMFELFVNTKKELSYAENSLFNSLISLQNLPKNVMEVPTGFEPVGRVLQTRA